MTEPTEPTHSAFPWGEDACEYGLTKQEYFAGQALIGILASGSCAGVDQTQIASDAVTLAVELIDQLNK